MGLMGLMGLVGLVGLVRHPMYIDFGLQSTKREADAKSRQPTEKDPVSRDKGGYFFSAGRSLNILEIDSHYSKRNPSYILVLCPTLKAVGI
jgi:hypothetical protein